MVRGGLSGTVLPLLRSTVRPSRVSFGTNWMTILSVTIHTAKRSITGTRRSVLAAAVLAGGGQRAGDGCDEAGAAGAELAGGQRRRRDAGARPNNMSEFPPAR